MKNNYIELIEKTASKSVKRKNLLRDRHTIVSNERPDGETRYLRDNNLRTYLKGSEVNFKPKINIEKVLNEPDGLPYYLNGVGKTIYDRDMHTTAYLPDAAREASKKRNLENKYDNTLNSIRDKIKQRTTIGKHAPAALGIAGMALGSKAGKLLGAKSKYDVMAGVGGLAGIFPGLIAGTKVGGKVDKVMGKLNERHYFNSLEDYQIEAIDKALTGRANQAANNPYSGHSYVS